LHALFTGEDDTWEAWLVFDTGPKLGSNTIKLRRGFCLPEPAKPSQVTYHVTVLIIEKQMDYRGTTILFSIFCLKILKCAPTIGYESGMWTIA